MRVGRLGCREAVACVGDMAVCDSGGLRTGTGAGVSYSPEPTLFCKHHSTAGLTVKVQIKFAPPLETQRLVLVRLWQHTRLRNDMHISCDQELTSWWSGGGVGVAVGVGAV
jgi:hypothetical protein